MRVTPSLCKLSSLRRSSQFRPLQIDLFTTNIKSVIVIQFSTFPFKLSLLAVQILNREIEPEYLLILK